MAVLREIDANIRTSFSTGEGHATSIQRRQSHAV
jgi:hypothetical protein